MNIEIIREYCLAKKAVTECFPFDDTTLVFKVCGKIFLLLNLVGKLSFNVKCDPENAIEYREMYPAVVPGYHMNKKHWNTVLIDGSLSETHIYFFIDHSYNLIYLSLTKKQQTELL